MNLNNNQSWGWNYQPQPARPFFPKYEIIEANDEESAYKIQMAPNSKTFIMHKTMPLVWLAETDGVGTLTLRPFDLVPHQSEPQINLNDLVERVKRLEDMYVQQSDIKQSKKQRNSSTNDSAT